MISDVKSHLNSINDKRTAVALGRAVDNLRQSSAAVLTATRTITAEESGSTFYLSSATEFVTTLPAPSLGLEYKFVVSAAPSGASYTIVSASSGNIIKGMVLTAQDAGGSGDSGTADDTITFVDGQAVAGDWVQVMTDGTSWFATAHCKVLAGVTFTQAS